MLQTLDHFGPMTSQCESLASESIAAESCAALIGRCFPAARRAPNKGKPSHQCCGSHGQVAASKLPAVARSSTGSLGSCSGPWRLGDSTHWRWHVGPCSGRHTGLPGSGPSTDRHAGPGFGSSISRAGPGSPCRSVDAHGAMHSRPTEEPGASVVSTSWRHAGQQPSPACYTWGVGA